MIQVNKEHGKVLILGHAGYAPYGTDIVCAGVTALVQTLIQSIEKLTEDKIQYDISPGRVDIKHGILSEAASLLMDSFFLGVYQIADEFPENVKIIDRDCR